MLLPERRCRCLPCGLSKPHAAHQSINYSIHISSIVLGVSKDFLLHRPPSYQLMAAEELVLV